MGSPTSRDEKFAAQIALRLKRTVDIRRVAKLRRIAFRGKKAPQQ
jgi:hypothetical protein